MMSDVYEIGSTKGGGGEQMAERCMSLILTLNHEGFEAEYVFTTLTDDSLWGCSSKFFEECMDFKMSFMVYVFSIFFDRGGVIKSCKAIGVAMGYKVAASNPGLDVHPFLRSWLAEKSWLLENCNSALGSPCLGHRQSALACLRHKLPRI